MIKELTPNGAGASKPPGSKPEPSPSTTSRQNTPGPKTEAKTKATHRKDKRTRRSRIYPTLPLEESLRLGDAIHQHASGERVNRLTLFKAINKSPTSSASQMLITASAKYRITNGSYVADYLELTEQGKVASDPSANPIQRMKARFELGIQNIEPFNALYTKYKGKRLPSLDVMTDALKEAKLDVADAKECIEMFIVNCKFIGLLQTRSEER